MKYTIQIARTVYYEKVYEADSREDAEDMAYEELSYGFDNFETVDESIGVYSYEADEER